MSCRNTMTTFLDGLMEAPGNTFEPGDAHLYLERALRERHLGNPEAALRDLDRAPFHASLGRRLVIGIVILSIKAFLGRLGATSCRGGAVGEDAVFARHATPNLSMKTYACARSRV